MPEKINSMNQVLQFLKKGIQSGTWPVGSQIPSEHEICSQLHVGRSSVRNALEQFTSLGVLESIHGKGTFVRSDDLSVFGLGGGTNAFIAFTVPLLEFRKMLEPELCYYATQRSTPQFIDSLTDCLGNMVANKDNSEQMVRYDALFHIEIARATGNPYALSTLSDIFLKNPSSFQQLGKTIGTYNGIYYHTQLLSLIRSGDAKKARALMHEHLDKTITELLAELDRP
ncbi:FadR/GntR family transcriptional regulator [Hespellia stercorisuis]|uniref:Regulatory protein, gntR family n=1 Tax=Hespellia stercorisuis DSM 15480 TaxID=1121950 RepID=A0A1M6UPP9_9FIRM|nr:FadR/GntR family transcriptional regulator [Hespellia stercorisuis]SHK71141.1 regulatory protein, gntR family [Hespellia stercorisuis DSM 15480]